MEKKIQRILIWIFELSLFCGYFYILFVNLVCGLGYGGIRYQSARCLMCGCCLEVCPNFDFGKDFAGAIAPVNAYRILNEEQDTSHHEQIAEKYRKHYFEGCGKSLSCQNICPAGIPVEELMVRSNAAAVWKK